MSPRPVDPAGRVVRSLVVWCPDWPLVAAGANLSEAAAVVRRNRVLACTPAARAAGVAHHQPCREAQARCPELTVLASDPARDARAFEPVVAALEALAPRLELARPGQVLLPTRGPSRYWGGDEALAAKAHRLASDALGERGPVRVGVAEGPFAAALAARAASPSCPVTVVPPGATAEFLAPLPLASLGRPGLADVLSRLGLHSLGDLAALPGPDVLARFGSEGLAAWRLAAGLDERLPATAPGAPDLTVATEIDPPVEQVEPAAFLARGLAAELHRRLAERGSACTRVIIGAETEHGERLERVWWGGAAGGGVAGSRVARDSGWGAGAQALTAAAIAERARWQLDGWLTGSSRGRPTAGIARLWLAPEEVVPATGRQLGFWGSDAAATERAARAVARAQGLLGPGAVAVPEWRGGRDPADQVALVGAEALDPEHDRLAARPGRGLTGGRHAAPWPGRVPAPSPAAVYSDPLPAEVVDAASRPVGVSGRGAVSAAPARIRIAGGPWLALAGWAGPWPLEERWWDPRRHRRRARFQLIAADGTAHLVAREGGAWHVLATYD